MLVAILGEYAAVLIPLRRVEESIQAAEEALALAERVGDLAQVSATLGHLAWITSTLQGRFAESRAYYDRALKLSEQVGDPSLVFHHLRRRAVLNFLSGDWLAVREDGERARALHPWKDEQDETCYPLLVLGQLSLAEGQWAEAARLLEEGIAVAERTHNLNGQVVGQAALAERDLLEGQPHQARARLEPLLAHLEQEDLNLVGRLSLLAWAALLLGEEPKSEAMIQQVLPHAQQIRIILPDVLRIQGLLRIQQARYEEARQALEETLSLCQAMPYPYAEAKALYVYGLFYQAMGDPEQARESLEAALAILHRMGERLYAEQVEQILAGLER